MIEWRLFRLHWNRSWFDLVIGAASALLCGWIFADWFVREPSTGSIGYVSPILNTYLFPTVWLAWASSAPLHRVLHSIPMRRAALARTLYLIAAIEVPLVIILGMLFSYFLPHFSISGSGFSLIVMLNFAALLATFFALIHIQRIQATQFANGFSLRQVLNSIIGNKRWIANIPFFVAMALAVYGSVSPTHFSGIGRFLFTPSPALWALLSIQIVYLAYLFINADYVNESRCALSDPSPRYVHFQSLFDTLSRPALAIFLLHFVISAVGCAGFVVALHAQPMANTQDLFIALLKYAFLFMWPLAAKTALRNCRELRILPLRASALAFYHFRVALCSALGFFIPVVFCARLIFITINPMLMIPLILLWSWLFIVVYLFYIFIAGAMRGILILPVLLGSTGLIGLLVGKAFLQPTQPPTNDVLASLALFAAVAFCAVGLILTSYLIRSVSALYQRPAATGSARRAR